MVATNVTEKKLKVAALGASQGTGTPLWNITATAREQQNCPGVSLHVLHQENRTD